MTIDNVTSSRRRAGEREKKKEKIERERREKIIINKLNEMVNAQRDESSSSCSIFYCTTRVHFLLLLQFDLQAAEMEISNVD